MLNPQKPSSIPEIKSSLYLLLQCASLVGNAFALRYMIHSHKSKPENSNVEIASISIFLISCIFMSTLFLWPIRANRKIRQEDNEKDPTPFAYEETLSLLSKVLKKETSFLHERTKTLCQNDLNVAMILILFHQNQQEKDISLNLATLYLSPKQKQNYLNALQTFEADILNNNTITLEQFDERIYQITLKDSQHNSVFSWSWFAFGNIGWQACYLLTLCSNAWSEKDGAFRSEHWNRTLITWTCAGLGTSLFLFLAIMISQKILSLSCFGGKPFGESYLMALQFLFSVTLSDGSWLFFSESPNSLLNWLGVTGELNIRLCVFLQILSYLIESFLFKNLHNASNYFHDYFNRLLFDGTQTRWTCTNSFTALLWLNYCGFNFFAMLMRAAIKSPDYSCDPITLILISLAGGIGGAILPILLDYAQHVQRMHEIKVCFSAARNEQETQDLEAAVANPMTANTINQPLVSPVQSENNKAVIAKKIQPSLMEYGCMLFNNTLSGFVQTVADSYAAPDLFIVRQ